jgi:hypothetical protein
VQLRLQDLSAEATSPEELSAMRLRRYLALIVFVTAALPSFGQRGPTRLLIRPSDQLMGTNSQVSYAATLAFFRGTGHQGGERPVATDITWSSSDTSEVTIDQTGKASSGNTPGTVTITARSGPFKATAQLTVSSATLSSIAVAPNNPSVPLGSSVQFSATGTYSDTSQRDLTDSVTWSSGTPAVAAISSLGFATTKTSGNTVVTATLGAVSGSSSLTVDKVSVMIAPPGTTPIVINATQQFNATVTGAVNTAVTWQVNGVTGGNATTGTVSTAGLYTAPVAVPNPATVTVTAVSQADANQSASAAVTVTPPMTATGHPRIWITADDLPRLRAWAVSTNPMYKDGIQKVAIQTKSDMDTNQLICTINRDETINFCETAAEVFALMSLIDPVSSEATDYAQRARTILMDRLVTPMLQAPHDPTFISDNRGRWTGEAFFTTVDWVYLSLTAADKAKILQLYTLWANDLINASTTTDGHPDPLNMGPNFIYTYDLLKPYENKPVLVQDRNVVRFAGNNYYTSEQRLLTMLSLVLDPQDDPNNDVRKFISTATGTRGYVVDTLMKNDCSGGLFAEGFEYSPQTTGYLAQYFLALHTAGADDPVKYGPQVVLSNTSFWSDSLGDLFHTLSPAPLNDPATYNPMGFDSPVYLPSNYGDMQLYLFQDESHLLGPLALYAQSKGDTSTVNLIRWAVANLPPGGINDLTRRGGDSNDYPGRLQSIFYFLLFDPSVDPKALPDPRPSLPLNQYVPGIGHLYSRTGWDTGAAWFHFRSGWNTVDHQHRDALSFNFYRKGEWLTKGLSTYGSFGLTNLYNSMAIQNKAASENDYRQVISSSGSQWTMDVDTPTARTANQTFVKAYAFANGYTYALGDATYLYNSEYEELSDVSHASRSIVWIKPDFVITYDRAETANTTQSRFKQVWVQTVNQATVAGNRAITVNNSGQQLIITSLLPPNAAITTLQTDIADAAQADPIKFRVKIDAVGQPQLVRFLTILQGADAGTAPDTATYLQSTGGTSFEGVALHGVAVLFPHNMNDGLSLTSLSYPAPAGVTIHMITGLTPNTSYSVSMGSTITITPGPGISSNAGGVLILGDSGGSFGGNSSGISR